MTQPPDNQLAQLTTGRILLSPTATTSPDGRREYACVFMQPGRVKQVDQKKSNWLIPADVIKADAHKFNSVASYLDHPEWFQDPKVKNLVGVTFDVRWSDEENALLGNIRLYDEKPDSPGALVGALMDQILADKTKGLEVPSIGLSATFYHDTTFDEKAGLRITTSFRHVESIDFVYDAGAGGYVRQALAAIGRNHGQLWTVGGIDYPGATPERSNIMPEEDTTSAAGEQEQVTTPPETQQPEPQQPDELQRLSTQVQQLTNTMQTLTAQAHPEPTTEDPPTVEQRLDTLSADVSRLATAFAATEAERTIIGLGQAPRGDSRITLGPTGLEEMQAAWDWIMGVDNAPLPEPDLRRTDRLYRLITGDGEFTGRFNERQALATANITTLADMAVNAMNKVIVPLYDRLANYRWYEQVVAVQPTDGSLHDMAWIRMGGIGNLPEKADGAAFAELVVADSKESDAFKTYGGYVGITNKMIRNSQIAKLQAIPKALTVSAIQTRSNAIAGIFTSNSGVGPTLDDDSVALFHTVTHANLATTSFSWAAWKAARLECYKQTELGSGKRIGFWPKFWLGPADLYDNALNYFGYGAGPGGQPGTGDQDLNPYAQDRVGDPRPTPIAVPEFTDTDDWAYLVDPLLMPVVCMAYDADQSGRTHPAPRLLAVISPTAGLMFSNNVMPIRVDDTWAYGVATYRGIGKRNV